MAGAGKLQIILWGYYDTDHDVDLWVNGNYVDNYQWSGIAFKNISVNDLNLIEGDNTVTLACNTALDGLIVDSFDVSYPRRFEAENNRLQFAHDSSYRYQINGFDTNDLVVFDITSATDPARVANVVISGSNPYTVEFEPPVNPGTTETYLVLDTAACKVPVGMSGDVASDLADTANGADYILITHRDLGWDANGDAYGWLSDLVALRESQGLRVKVVDVADIFDEFSYGMTSSAAIKDFLAYASGNWQPPAPQYVLLVGDGTYDAKDNLSQGSINFVPPYLTFTGFNGRNPHR